MDAKEVAARKAVEAVKDGMVLGLGTGSTSTFAIHALGERVQREGLKISGIPTSAKSASLAATYQIPLVDLSDVDGIDLAIDGADEVDADLNLIKGGGGALLREKLVASASREFIVIVDDRKVKSTLGAFPLPVAVVPFGWRTTYRRLEHYGVEIVRRESAPGAPFLSDDGLFMLDMHFGQIADVPTLEKEIKATTGVVDVGLFVGLASKVIVGYADGRIEERSR